MQKTDSLHRGWILPAKETLFTVASGITLVRTLIAVIFAVLAILHDNQWLLLAGLASYWVGDILDGIVARALHQEMRSGAVLDIMADRLCVSLIYLTYGYMHPDMMWEIGIYLVEFMFIDGFLSLAFLFWPLLSPNYFFLVDRQIFKLNWSPAGKVVNSSLFLLATVFIGSPILSASIATAVTGLKLYSLRRLYTQVIPNVSLKPGAR
jgi:CDP-diacylglycerol--glycerol-3-phosphate 3-phosphatidyltransferase